MVPVFENELLDPVVYDNLEKGPRAREIYRWKERGREREGGGGTCLLVFLAAIPPPPSPLPSSIGAATLETIFLLLRSGEKRVIVNGPINSGVGPPPTRSNSGSFQRACIKTDISPCLLLFFSWSSLPAPCSFFQAQQAKSASGTRQGWEKGRRRRKMVFPYSESVLLSSSPPLFCFSSPSIIGLERAEERERERERDGWVGERDDEDEKKRERFLFVSTQPGFLRFSKLCGGSQSGSVLHMCTLSKDCRIPGFSWMTRQRSRKVEVSLSPLAPSAPPALIRTVTFKVRKGRRRRRRSLPPSFPPLISKKKWNACIDSPHMLCREKKENCTLFSSV